MYEVIVQPIYDLKEKYFVLSEADMTCPHVPRWVTVSPHSNVFHCYQYNNI